MRLHYLHTYIHSVLYMAILLQLAVLSRVKVRHCHQLNCQTGPASEMLCPLTISGFWIILFPCETCLIPRIGYSIDQVLPQGHICLGRPLLMRSFCLGKFL